MEFKSSPLQKESWKLQIDLAGDLENQTYQILVSRGYRDADPKRALYQYYNLKKRIPESSKRTVHKSRQ